MSGWPSCSACHAPADASCTLSNVAVACIGRIPTDDPPPPRLVYTSSGAET
jgi:hypothetical protein